MTDKSKPNKFPLLNFMGFLLAFFVFGSYWSQCAQEDFTELSGYAVLNGYIENPWLIYYFEDIMFILSFMIYLIFASIVFKPSFDYSNREQLREIEEDKRRNKPRK